MAEIKWLKDNEYPTPRGDWVLITREGPVWSINSATSTGDSVPSVPIGAFHLLDDLLACTIKWADHAGIDWIYIRPGDDFAHF